ncbi:substrate-binding domain-containing protein [Rodentibacter ratti]|uniref:substrate-binding domain-containing protein n=1 Tax=Rodentibacter ratti TaxID=1906745 RepID=UPI0021188F11|nr:substrate-binding domain-containing protein [Rodentibacter ratti]
MDIQCVCGPAGLLRRRIEKGEHCDLFISANRENVTLLARSVPIFKQSLIAFNRLVLTTLEQGRFHNKSFFELLFDRQLRLATSTPHCDPCGDYTWQLFEHIERVFPSEGNALKTRALPLVGGENTSIVPKGNIASQYLLSHGYAEMMLGYGHYQVRLKNEGLLYHELPEEFAIRAEYVEALLTKSEIVQKFFDFLSSESSKKIIWQHGFYVE